MMCCRSGATFTRGVAVANEIRDVTMLSMLSRECQRYVQWPCVQWSRISLCHVFIPENLILPFERQRPFEFSVCVCVRMWMAGPVHCTLFVAVEHPLATGLIHHEPQTVHRERPDNARRDAT